LVERDVKKLKGANILGQREYNYLILIFFFLEKKEIFNKLSPSFISIGRVAFGKAKTKRAIACMWRASSIVT
jgi:hypothetical protein